MRGRGLVIGRVGMVLIGVGVALSAASASSSAGATEATNRISGVVRNGSRGTVAANDEVVLVRLAASDSNQAAGKFQLTHDAHEEARTHSDGRGLFTFTLPMRRSDESYLLRIVHEGVSYDRPVAAGDFISADVFDSAKKVSGIAGTVEVIRIGSHGKFLHVSDMIEIRNGSDPPVTLSGERTFEVYLPLHAKISSVLAAAPRTGLENIGEMISAAVLRDEPGHYAVRFPLRPGSTKFAFNYDVPYQDGVKFVSRRKYPVRQLAVMIPPSMKFTSLSSSSFTSSSAAFQVLSTGNNRYLVEGANQVPAGVGPEFEISPEQVSSAQASPKLPAEFELVPLAHDLQSTPTLGAASVPAGPSSSPSPFSSLPPSLRRLWLRRWVMASVVLMLGGVYGFIFRRKRRLSGGAIRAVAVNQGRGVVSSSNESGGSEWESNPSETLSASHRF